MLLHEISHDIIQALSRGRVRPYGAPRRIQFDEAKCFCRNEIIAFLDRNNSLVDAAPGEAHAWLGIVERRHQVLRTALGMFIREERIPPNGRQRSHGDRPCGPGTMGAEQQHKGSRFDQR